MGNKDLQKKVEEVYDKGSELNEPENQSSKNRGYLERIPELAEVALIMPLIVSNIIYDGLGKLLPPYN